MPDREQLKAASAERWARHHSNPGEWFWDRADRSGGPTACWPWLGAIMAGSIGYGRLRFKGRYVGAHRMALSLVTGEHPPREIQACHTCDNPVCCNPGHLFWGTNADNIADCAAKGRKRGARPKIDVTRLLILREEGKAYSELAAIFQVNQASIGKALKRAALRARQAFK